MRGDSWINIHGTAKTIGYGRYISGFLAYLACTLCGGCIFWQSAEYRRIPDPETDKFVEVVGANGNTLTLKNGHKIRLDGLDVESLTGDARKIYDQQIHRTVIGRKIIVIEHNGFSRAEMSTYSDPGRHAGPQKEVIYVKPIRRDVALELISSGFAGTDVHSITDEEWKKRYLTAEEYAKSHKMGIWDGPRASELVR